MMKFRLGLLIRKLLPLVVASAFSAASPLASPAPLPVWPPTFASDFVSDYKATHGRYSVHVPLSGDAAAAHAASERIDMADGMRDHLCSAYHNGTACTHLTTAGFRYLYFPDIDDCCKCCSYATGSYACGGPLGPQWVKNATGNLLYMGVEAVRGAACHKWDVLGLGDPPHDNFYFQFVDSGLPCEVDALNYLRTPEQRADDQYIFSDGSYTTHVPAAVVEVPPMCADARFCGPPVCDAGPPPATAAIHPLAAAQLADATN